MFFQARLVVLDSTQTGSVVLSKEEDDKPKPTANGLTQVKVDVKSFN